MFVALAVWAIVSLDRFPPGVMQGRWSLHERFNAGGSMARDIDKRYPRPAFIAKLRRLADALERDRPFAIMLAGRRLVVPRQARCGVEYERAGGREELELQLRWEHARARRHRARR